VKSPSTVLDGLKWRRAADDPEEEQP